MKTKLKQFLTAGIASFALMLSFTALTQPVAYAGNATFDKGMGQGASAAQGKDQAQSLFGDDNEGGGIFQTITNILLFIIGAVSVIMLIIGGIRYTTSGGDQGAVKSAKDTILYAIIGIIVAILAYAIVNFVIKGLSNNTQG